MRRGEPRTRSRSYGGSERNASPHSKRRRLRLSFPTLVTGWVTMDANKNAELMLEVFRAIEQRDAQRVFSLSHADVEFLWPPSLPYAGGARGAWTETWIPLQPTRAEQRMDPRIVAATDQEVTRPRPLSTPRRQTRPRSDVLLRSGNGYGVLDSGKESTAGRADP